MRNTYKTKVKKGGDSKKSVVSILTMNRLSLTQRAVNSILKNSTEDVRIVFLDNASTDGTLEYLHDLGSDYSDSVTVLTSGVNLGVSRGRNVVAEHAMRTYGNSLGWVLSLDNDCLVHRGYDEAITAAIEEEGAQVVCPRLIQPNGNPFYNANMGFMIDLEGRRLKLEYETFADTGVKKMTGVSRLESDVILGTSAKTPEFIRKVGGYDEGHKIGWEDFSLSLKALGLTRKSFEDWAMSQDVEEGKWISLKDLMDGQNKPLAKIIFEPECLITHDHPMTEEFKGYEAIRRREKTIQESTDHFENTWGVRPVSRRD